MSYGSTNMRAMELKPFSYENFKVLTLEEKEYIIKVVAVIFFLVSEDEPFSLLNGDMVSFENFHPLRDANHALLFYHQLVSRQIPISIISDSWYDGEGVKINVEGNTVIAIHRDYADESTTYNQIWNEAICVAFLIIEDAMTPIDEAEQVKNEQSKKSILKMLEGFKKDLA